MLRPNGNGERNWQHRQAHNHKAGNRKYVIANQSAQETEVLAPQGKTPLEQKERHNQTRENRVSNGIEEGRQFHWISGEFFDCCEKVSLEEIYSRITLNS